MGQIVNTFYLNQLGTFQKDENTDWEEAHLMLKVSKEVFPGEGTDEDDCDIDIEIIDEKTKMTFCVSLKKQESKYLVECILALLNTSNG